MDTLKALIVIAVVMGVVLNACNYLIWLERKVSAWMQDRRGPNRVGPAGLIQPIADGIKMLLKEDVIPAHVDRTLYMLAPAISVFTTMLALAVVPFGPTDTAFSWFRFVIAPNIDIGIVFIFAVTSLAVYGVILGGWASNSKYSALGSLRSSAQVISYEIPLGMSVLGVALLGGTLNLSEVVEQQARAGFAGWYAWTQPLAAVIFYTAALAESNRLPFDLPECEQELVGGYHTEYSALKWGMFFLGEYTHVITISFLVSILFFGGWHFPGIATPDSHYFGAWVVKLLVLLAKVFASILLIMLIRWTIPRFRFDQLMGLAWKGLIPLSVANVVCVMTVRQFGLSPWWLTLASLLLFLGAGAVSLGPSRSQAVVVRPGAVAGGM